MGVLMSAVSHNGSFKCGYVPALTIGHIFRALILYDIPEYSKSD